jgi:hypothetical protein
MPTLQTTPWINWTFPDQAYARNKVGRHFVEPHIDPRLEAEVGGANPFDAHDKAVALDRLRNNHAKMLGQMGVRNTTERSQRYFNNDSQSQSHFNGKFMEPSYKFTQTPGGLRGGNADPDDPRRIATNGGFGTGGAMTGGTQYVFYSKTGQDYLKNLRTRRIAELNAISTGSFPNGLPKRVPVEPQYDLTDAALSKVMDMFESGAFPASLIDDLNKLQTAFITVAGTISATKLAQYVQVIGRLTVQSERISAVGGGPFQLDAQQRRTVRASGLVLDRLNRLLLEINRTVNEPENVRQRAAAEISSRILGSITSSQTAFGNPEPGRQRQTPTGPDRDVATRGELENRQAREPAALPEAELVTSAGEPPVRPF